MKQRRTDKNGEEHIRTEKKGEETLKRNLKSVILLK